MYKLVIINHGEGKWESENRFTGWTDTGLTEEGTASAKKAGELLAARDYYFDYAFASMLTRSLQTLWYVLEASDQLWIPWEKSWKLNDRHWGSLEGRKESDITREYGEEQVKQWKESYQIKPPQVDIKDKRFPGNDRRYNSYPVNELPRGESMEEVTLRVVKYWLDVISPVIKSESKVLISAHEYSLRALVKHLERISDEEISAVTIEAGKPLIYELDANLFHRNHYYLEKVQHYIRT